MSVIKTLTLLCILILLSITSHAHKISLHSPSYQTPHVSIDWSSLTPQQLSSLPNNVLASATRQNIQSIPAESCIGFTSSQLAVLSIEACSGFSSSQVSNFNPNACYGFKSTCFTGMNPEAFQGFRGDCIQQIPSKEFSGIDSAQKLSAFSLGAVSSFSSNDLRNLDPLICSGFSSEQVGSIHNDGNGNGACSGFTSECFNLIKRENLRRLSGFCVKAMNPEIFDHMSGIQFSNIPSVAMEGLRKDQLSRITNAVVCSNFTRDQISNLNVANQVCAGFSGTCLQAVRPSEFSGFFSDCLHQLDPKVFQYFNVEQVQNLRAESFKGMTGYQIYNFKPETCQAFSSNQLSQLQPENNQACTGFRPDCIRNVPPIAFYGFSGKCFTSFPKETLMAVQAQQLEQVNPTTCSSFNYHTVDPFNSKDNQVCSGFTSQCLSQIGLDAMMGMNAQCFSQIPPSSLQGLNKYFIQNINIGAFAGATANQFAALYTYFGNDYFVNVVPRENLRMVSREQVVLFKTKIENGEIVLTRKFSPNDLTKLSWLKLALSTPNSLSEILTPTNILSIDMCQTFYGLLNNSQIYSQAIYHYLTVDKLNCFLRDTINGITAGQLSMIDPRAFVESSGSFAQSFLYVNPLAVNGLTEQQLNSLLVDDFLGRAMTCDQFKNLNSAQQAFIQNTNSYTVLQKKCMTLPPKKH
ncbi:hypothetical protein C9374_010570 [Naegleria lovaniensis]|uniref:Conjugal transfer protein TraN n=1 Tax=Naegleria lovaniensis TaxID=51637 RepID=A0AA88GI39_NAELO|nr:uncharacterized protein C9374_010570 [Naegleria lovaniensis]KAG2374551.1 hypothetical protein C9374_010570 [Naegleria lovaniensis]